ncbi:hypothetical protein SGPA1_80093 [Streptomyces misionensis JCM 4497]
MVRLRQRGRHLFGVRAGEEPGPADGLAGRAASHAVPVRDVTRTTTAGAVAVSAVRLPRPYRGARDGGHLPSAPQPPQHRLPLGMAVPARPPGWC